MYRPIKGEGLRLIMPLLYLVPCLSLIINPMAHAPAWEWGAAAAIGLLLSLPLIWTTNFERRADQQIYAVKNISFIIAIVAVVMIRFGLRDYLSNLNEETMAALFMLVLLSYVIPWRIVSYLKFRKVYLSSKIV